MSDEPDVRPEDALQVAQRALSKANDLESEFDELLEDYDDLSEELTAIKLRLSEEDDDADYRDLSLDTKIGMVREHAYKKAAGGPRSGRKTRLVDSDQ